MTDEEKKILKNILQAKDIMKTKTIYNNIIVNGYTNLEALRNRLYIEQVSEETFIFITSLCYTSFPKNGRYMPLYILTSLRNTYKNLCKKSLYNVIIQTKNFYYDLTSEQAEKILPDLLLKKYYKNKNTKIKQNELLNITLNTFAFNIFKNNISKLKYITIKDSLYYLSILRELQIKTINNSKHENYHRNDKVKLLFEYAGLIFNKTRNPNTKIYNNLEKLSKCNSLCSSYQYCLPNTCLERITDWNFFEEKFTDLNFTFTFSYNLFSNIITHYVKFDVHAVFNTLNYTSFSNLDIHRIESLKNYSDNTLNVLYYLLKYTSKINKTFAKMKWVKEIVTLLESTTLPEFRYNNSRELYNFETYVYKQLEVISINEKFPQFPLKNNND